MFYYASALATVVAGGIMFSGCPFVCTCVRIHVNMMYWEHLEGISPNLGQSFTQVKD